MLYDCFLFFNELDLLEIRLGELAESVDRFVLVECAWTHQGKPKPLVFAENRERFAEWLPMIEHVVVTDHPDTTEPMVLEPFHRECLARGLHAADPEDLAMISDLDEIPSPAAIAEGRRRLAAREADAFAFEQALYYYFVNGYQCQCTGTRIAPVRVVRERGPQKMRHTGWTALRRDGMPNWGGWHFSYLGGKKAIREKTAAFCHPGCGAEKWMNDAHLDRVLATGHDLYDRSATGRFVDVDDSWPQHFLANRERFAHLEKELP